MAEGEGTFTQLGRALDKATDKMREALVEVELDAIDALRDGKPLSQHPSSIREKLASALDKDSLHNLGVIAEHDLASSRDNEPLLSAPKPHTTPAIPTAAKGPKLREI
jgi:hypothetical protein